MLPPGTVLDMLQLHTGNRPNHPDEDYDGEECE